MDDIYKNDYDDPYRFLASGVATHFSIECAKRMLVDKDYIRQVVQSEVRDNIDVPGIFSDCITTELISKKNKVLYRDALNRLGLFFFEQLDIDRFRKNLIEFYEEFEIDITPDKK